MAQSEILFVAVLNTKLYLDNATKSQAALDAITQFLEDTKGVAIKEYSEQT